eukprot:TRINITY_DN3888_c0_g2_i2.p1 TRINITY_DN3888_c0_g2~~TRINITY_DN3888_c0_g2_i2.p1  ORF type:complete len:102 (+),score=13.88 TRINITY_DN3888_c0_g2_i2:134-439(+)
MDIVSPENFLNAKSDPISKFARPIVERINSTSQSDINLMCKEFAQKTVTNAFIFSLDRKGFDVMGQEEAGWYEFRFPWEHPIEDLVDYKYRLETFVKEMRK